jgi:hypothetical protein
VRTREPCSIVSADTVPSLVEHQAPGVCVCLMTSDVGLQAPRPVKGGLRSLLKVSGGGEVDVEQAPRPVEGQLAKDFGPLIQAIALVC